MGAKTRRLENNLVTLGTGVIAFGLWAFIKLILTVILLGSAYYEDAGEEDQLAAVISTWVIAILTVLRGMSARAEGKGKHVKPVYLFFAGMICVYSLAIILLEAFYLITDFIDIDDPLILVITIFIDVTRMVFLIQLIYSSVALRKIRKQAKKEVSV